MANRRRHRGKTSGQWKPAHFWRIEDREGNVWAEGTDEANIRNRIRPGDRLYQWWYRTEEEWRAVNDGTTIVDSGRTADSGREAKPAMDGRGNPVP